MLWEPQACVTCPALPWVVLLMSCSVKLGVEIACTQSLFSVYCFLSQLLVGGHLLKEDRLEQESVAQLQGTHFLGTQYDCPHGAG